MKTPLPSLLLGILIWSSIQPRCQAFESPSGPGDWLWEINTMLNGRYFNFYNLHSGLYTEVVLCVFQCLQIRECQSITVQTLGAGFHHCRFHSRRFSHAESSYLSDPQPGLEYYEINSNCQTSDSHFFSREARMCISVNVVKRKKQEARDYCNGLGGDLVIIDNQKKEAFIADVMTQYSSWTTICFHTDAQAVGEIYKWSNGNNVSSDILTAEYDPQNECVEVIYDSIEKLAGQLYDCSSKRVAVICEYPI